MADTFTALKGKLSAPADRYFGLFLLIINHEKKNIANTVLVITSAPEAIDHRLSDSWESFEKSVMRYKYKGDFAKSVTSQVEETFKALSNDPDFYSDLAGSIKSSNNTEAVDMLEKIFDRFFRRDDLSITVEFEKIAESDLKAREEPEKADAAGDDTEGVYLDVSLMLDPVNGKLVTDLSKGDEIAVKINPVNAKADYFIDRLKLRDDDTIRPAKGSVQKLTGAGKGYEITVELDDGVYGRVYEEEKVLLRKYSSLPASSQTKKESDKKDGQKRRKTDASARDKQSRLILWGSALLVIMLLILALVYFLS